MLRISQQTFAEQLADQYGIELGKSVPLPVGTKLAEFDKNEAQGDWPFRDLVGSLMWLSTQTRPDISNAARAVARYSFAPTLVHWRAALGILGYVRRTRSFGSTFRRGTTGGLNLHVFADADYASKAADRRSVSGGLVMCGGACVSWFSRTQKCVTLSTTEAEYVALADVMKKVLILGHVWRFRLPEVGVPCIPVFEDDQGAVQLAQNPITNSNSKHIDVRHHFLRELVGRKEIPGIEYPRTIPFSACRLPDQSNFAGVFRVPSEPCDEFEVILLTEMLNMCHGDCFCVILVDCWLSAFQHDRF